MKKKTKIINGIIQETEEGEESTITEPENAGLENENFKNYDHFELEQYQQEQEVEIRHRKTPQPIDEEVEGNFFSIFLFSYINIFSFHNHKIS